MLISDTIIAVVFTIIAAVLMWASKDDIEAWAEEQRKHYR